jgi:hypothetical protein
MLVLYYWFYHQRKNNILKINKTNHLIVKPITVGIISGLLEIYYSKNGIHIKLFHLTGLYVYNIPHCHL